MTLQSHYPSLLLFTNRKGQGMLGRDQSGMSFNNGVGVNSRKRKEIADTTVPSPPINPFSLQDTEAQRQQQQQQRLTLPLSTFSYIFREGLSAQIKEQSKEIDQIIKTHGDQLRRTLAETRKGHNRALVGAAGDLAANKLRETVQELEKSGRRNAELEERAAHFRVEARVWQAKARTLEETVASLRAALQEAMMRGVGSMEESNRLWCAVGGGEAQAEDAESAFVDPERVEPILLACKACQKGTATVMMWPCRHLCVCTKCDASVMACPICHSLKTTSVQVNLQ